MSKYLDQNGLEHFWTKIKDKIDESLKIVEVDELPSIPWKGTAVPSSGHVGHVYFNTKLSVAEVNAILDRLTFTVNADGIMTYTVTQNLDSTRQILILKDILGEESPGYMIAVVYSDPAEDTNATIGDLIFNSMLLISYVDSGGPEEDIPYGWSTSIYHNFMFNDETNSGTQNDLLSELISITNFVVDENKETPDSNIIYNKRLRKDLYIMGSSIKEFMETYGIEVRIVEIEQLSDDLDPTLMTTDPSNIMTLYIIDDELWFYLEDGTVDGVTKYSWASAYSGLGSSFITDGGAFGYEVVSDIESMKIPGVLYLLYNKDENYNSYYTYSDGSYSRIDSAKEPYTVSVSLSDDVLLSSNSYIEITISESQFRNLYYDDNSIIVLSLSPRDSISSEALIMPTITMKKVSKSRFGVFGSGIVYEGSFAAKFLGSDSIVEISSFKAVVSHHPILDADNTQYNIPFENQICISAVPSIDNAIKQLSVSGRTITYTKFDGTTGSISTQDTTYSEAGSSLGLVKSGGDVTISYGIITVKDDSHNHTIANIDDLQEELNLKLYTGDFNNFVNNFLPSNYASSDHTHSDKQDNLVSGTNIKTINGTSILGSGDITISGGVIVDDTLSSASTNPVQNKVLYEEINYLYDNKQDTLASGTNIRTINGESLLGGGDIKTSTFKILNRHTIGVNGYVDLLSYMEQYDELMIIVRSVPNASTVIGISGVTSGSSDFLTSVTISGTSYLKITMNKTDEGYFAWTISGNSVSSFGWTGSIGYQYIRNYSASATSNSMSVVVHGR